MGSIQLNDLLNEARIIDESEKSAIQERHIWNNVSGNAMRKTVTMQKSKVISKLWWMYQSDLILEKWWMETHSECEWGKVLGF